MPPTPSFMKTVKEALAVCRSFLDGVVIFHFTKEIKNVFQQEIDLFEQEMELFFRNSRPLIKIFILINVSYFHQGAQN